MPLTAKGSEIKSALTKEYGEAKGEQVLYAGKNKGTFSGIDAAMSSLCDSVEKLNRRVDSYCARRADENSPAYEAALIRFRDSSAKFREAQRAYRARETDDKQFLAAKAAFDEATREMDRATPAGH